MAAETGAAGGGGAAAALSASQLDLAIALIQVLSDDVKRVGDYEIWCPDREGALAVSAASVNVVATITANDTSVFDSVQSLVAEKRLLALHVELPRALVHPLDVERPLALADGHVHSRRHGLWHRLRSERR